MLRVGLVSEAPAFNVSNQAFAWKFILHRDNSCWRAHVDLGIAVAEGQQEVF